MTDRLVLGCGSIGAAILEALADRRGQLFVVTDDERRVDTLDGAGVTVVPRDPSDRAVLADVDVDPETVLVAGDDPARNVAAAAAAARAFPDAYRLAYAGEGASATQRDRLADTVDDVVEPERAAAEFVLERAGDRGLRTRNLQAALRGVDGHLAVVTHDNPDPDAIASAVALARIAEASGLDTGIYYYGDISHQENRAFVNLLEYDLTRLEPDAVPEPMDGVALVDHSRPGVNDGLPRDTAVDIVIDHHPPRVPVEARFVDLRANIGATSTLLVEYLEALQVPLETDVATGLLYGIRVDTNEFRREVSPTDFEAAATLLASADLDVLKRIESPTVDAETLETVGRAIENRVQEGSVLLSGVGVVGNRDALAQAADRLLNLETVSATLVYGIQDDTVYVSARARGTDIDLGETLRDAFGQIGSAGGHADMAGAQVTLGVLESPDDAATDREAVVEEVITDRFFEALDSRDDRLLGDVFGPTPYDVDGFEDEAQAVMAALDAAAKRSADADDE